MSNTKQDLRQISSKTDNSRELGLSNNYLLSNLVDNINIDLDFPLKISASFPTPDSKINFSDSKIIAADNTVSITLPIQGQIFTDLASLWIDFQAQTVSNPSDFEITWPTSNTVSYYRIAGFTLVGAGKISVIFSDEFSLETNLENPGNFFVSSGLPLGYVILQCTDSSGKFKTAGSASNIIENSNIFRFDSRSGGGGEGSGEINNAVNVGIGEGFYKQKVGVDLRFKSLVAAGNATITSSIDSISISTGAVEINTASNTGTGIGLFKQKIGTDLQFKSLVAGTATTISSMSDEIIISTPLGETNTASNVGTGAGIFKQKIGANLEFKSLVAGAGFSINQLSESIELISLGGEANTASNVGTGINFFKDKIGANLRFRSLTSGFGTSIVSGSNSITINDTTNTAVNPYVLGDIVESAMNYSSFQAALPDGSTWVPLDGRDVTDSDLSNSALLSSNFLTLTKTYEILNSPIIDVVVGGLFGHSVSVDGGYIVIGAPNQSNIQGRAFIFKKNTTGFNDWTSIKTLTHTSSIYEQPQFGWSVAISGDYIVVGGPLGSGTPGVNLPNAGQAYVFKKDSGGVDNWGLIKTLNSNNPDASDYFGWSVAISGDYIVVGAPQDDGSTETLNDAGEAYVFKKDSGGVDNWGLIKTLNSNNPDASDKFGSSVAINSDYIVVGAPQDDGSTETLNNAGEAYVFKKDSGGVDNWGFAQTLNSNSEDVFFYFGNSVSISGDYIIVGAYSDISDGATHGKAYLYKKNTTGIESWDLIRQLSSPSSPDDNESGEDSFGWSVAINGDSVIVGAYKDGGNFSSPTYSGEVYVFDTNFQPISLTLPEESGKYIKINN